jgi:hypothetical protein
VSYFRPQQAGKIGPRTILDFSDSTSLLSQNVGAGQNGRCANPKLSQQRGSPQPLCAYSVPSALSFFFLFYFNS